MQLPVPRVTVIEGRRVLVVDRRPPLPRTLDHLIRAMQVTWRAEVLRPGGATARCVGAQDHRLVRFMEGRYIGPDAVVRDLRLLMCADCEAVCVRDVTTDLLPTHRRRPARRRDGIMGWYTGARPRQRTYL